MATPEPLLNNPSVSEVLRLLADVVSTELRVALPGKILTYDDTTHLADVQPLFKSRAIDSETARDLPVIKRVSVIQARCAAGAVLLPLAKDDPVTLLVSDRALDGWRASTGASPIEPPNGRRHDLSDCWAIPGGYPEGVPLAPKYPGALEIQVNSSTKVAITNGNVELLDMLDQVMTLLNETLTNIRAMTQGVTGSLTTIPLVNDTAFETTATTLATLVTDLAQLKP